MEKENHTTGSDLWTKRLEFERFVRKTREDRLDEQISRLRQKIESLLSEGSVYDSAPGKTVLPPPQERETKKWFEGFITSEADGMIAVHELVFGINHQLKGALSVIGSGAQYWLNQKKSPPELKKYLEVVLKNVKRIETILEEVSAFTRPYQLQKKEQDIQGLFDQIHSLIRERANNSGVNIIIEDKTPGPVIILMDRDLLLEAFLNLVINALEAMPHGGDLTIKVELDTGERKLNIIIKDTGEGIPEEYLKDVFAPFFTTRPRNFGLGLPLARRIIKVHEGTITLTSEQRIGTEVKVALPYVG